MELLSGQLGVILFIIGLAIFGNKDVWGTESEYHRVSDRCGKRH